MRYWVGLMLVVALVGLPLSASAQSGDDSVASEPSAVLQLEVNDAGFEVAPKAPPNEIESMKAGIRRSPATPHYQ